PGLQPGHLPAAAGPAEADQGLDVDDAAGEVGQDRGEGRVAREVHRLPTGGGSGAPPAVRGDAASDRPAATSVRLRLRFAAFDKAVCQVSRSVQGAPGGPISEKEQRSRVWCAGLGLRRGGRRQRFLGGQPLVPFLRGIKWPLESQPMPQVASSWERPATASPWRAAFTSWSSAQTGSHDRRY